MNKHAEVFNNCEAFRNSVIRNSATRNNAKSKCEASCNNLVDDKTNNSFTTSQQKTLDYNAGAGLFVVFAMFLMFFLVPVTALISFGFKINLLPMVVAIMCTAVVVVALIMLFRFIDTLNLTFK